MLGTARTRLAVLSAMLILGVACGGDKKAVDGSPTPTVTAGPVATNAVKAVDSSFSPSAITVTAGTEVVWTFDGTLQHSVTADDKSYDSTLQNKGATFKRAYATAGTYRYYCTLHGAANGVGMSGTVLVT